MGAGPDESTAGLTRRYRHCIGAIATSVVASILILLLTDPGRLLALPFRIAFGLAALAVFGKFAFPWLCLLQMWYYLGVAGRNQEWLRQHLATEIEGSSLLRRLFDAPGPLEETPYAATAYVLSPDRKQLLMVFHSVHRKWLPPGGRLLSNEIFDQAVMKRVCSETGLPERALHFCSRYHPDRKDHIGANEPVQSHPTPWIVQDEVVEQRGGLPYHHDFLYVLESESQGPLHGKQNPQWLTLEQIEELSDDGQVFLNVRNLARKLLK